MQLIEQQIKTAPWGAVFHCEGIMGDLILSIEGQLMITPSGVPITTTSARGGRTGRW
ncbi:hypothetical protein J4G66_13375 [Aeromonas dhakensis]|uniref:hypothetical protein n=1 Tax=Aeromonas dhakensis TaxID=196024 RepID=UPI00039E1746|nr:hypothetical protein [Aeromonas dhakensis]MBF8449909.1 hypothetical protein [Aeromonas dhakensis]MBS4716940.1 hypothetical protein [Aeromonas dhakensis]